MNVKKIIGTVIIIVATILITKILYLKLMDDICENVENFSAGNNRYYKVEISQKGGSRTEEVLYNDIVKYNIYVNGVKTICQWKDFSTGEEYDVNLENKQIYDSDMLLKNKNFTPNLSHFMYYIKEYDFIQRLSKIYYVLPVNYDGMKCYKIVSAKEEIVVDRENLLPVYCKSKMLNLNKEFDGEIEYKYNFNIGNVKPEDVELPNTKEFEIIDKSE